MIVARLLPHLRQHWPDTHILVRGDSHFASPELMHLIAKAAADRVRLWPVDKRHAQAPCGCRAG